MGKLKFEYMKRTNKLCSNCMYKHDRLHLCSVPIKAFDVMLGEYGSNLNERCSLVYATRYCKYKRKEDQNGEESEREG